MTLGLCATALPAQTILTELNENQIPLGHERSIVPQRYRTFQLDRPSLQTLLGKIPGPAASSDRDGTPALISLPLPDGGEARFYLESSTVMAPDLQARYPQIRSFTGRGVDDPSALLKCDWTPQGFHAMMFLTGKSTVFIDPYAKGDAEHYVVYYKKDFAPDASVQSYRCGVDSEMYDPEEDDIRAPVKVSERGIDGQQRLYRLAVACTGEYAQFHGGTRELALAAIVTSVTRLTGLYEREFAVTFQLVAKNDSLIYLDGATDPYENGNTGVMLGQNRTVCNARIGGSNYDIGHVYGTHPSVSGLASLRAVCTQSKAQGVSCYFSPVGDPFYITLVAHEMGHQFGANHTQNNDCNRNDGTAMETGSGSTIMGYSGICAPNVQNEADDYYHGVNVAEIVNFIVNGSGDGCPVKTDIDNTAPTVSAGPNVTIPASTPFVLTAQANDSDGDANRLTYCWEQMDAEAGDMPPVATSTLGPLFRTLPPDTLPRRFFPRLQTLVQNQASTWEVLPSVGRKMNFRITVRDNHPSGGNTAQDDMLVTVHGAAGPFRVADLTPGTAWSAGAWETVTWDVANTDQAPVNCRRVNIRLSTDGGFTYPVLLASNVPNIGKWCVPVPDITTTKARLMVEAADNIFFDISNANFSIGPAPAPAFSLCLSELIGQVCMPNAYTATVSTASLQGFDKPVTLTATGLPPGATASFSPNPVTPGSDAVLTVTFADGTPEGTVAIAVEGAADAAATTIVTELTLVSNNFSSLALLAPGNGVSGQPENPILRWQKIPDANTYEVELATNPSFDASVIVASGANILIDSFKIPVILEKGNVYYWRVRPVNECGKGEWVGPFAFATLLNVCLTRNAGDLPKTITGNQAVTVEAKLTINGGSTISDINVAKLQGNHQFFREIEVSLISPKGTVSRLFKGKCGGYSGSFNLGFDDASPNGTLTCPPSTLGALFQPETPLSQFNGENAEGEWTIQIKDDSPGSGGQLTGFSLEICANTTLNPPVLVNNNILFIEPGTNKSVSTDLLKTEDADNSDNELIYTLMTLPKHGQLQLNASGNALLPGAQFAQSDLNNGGVRYFHYGGAETDDFCFTVTDGQGGLIQDCFTVQPFPLSAGEANRKLDFALMPNPATESFRITFGETLPSDTRVQLLDAAGRMLVNTVFAQGQVGGLVQVAGLPRGLYLVSVDNAKGAGVQKIVLR